MNKTIEIYKDTLDEFKRYCTGTLTNSPQSCQFYQSKRKYVCQLPDGTKMQFVYNSIVSTFTKLLVPDYIQSILKQVRPIDEAYTYILNRINPYRRRYSIYDDITKLEKWARRQGADFIIKKENTTPNHCYIVFEMTDPVAMQLEKERFIN